jgi:hypothetical protein
MNPLLRAVDILPRANHYGWGDGFRAMSSENIERQIEFILEHQARFSQDLDRLKEVQAQQAANIDRLTSDVQLLNETVSIMQVEMEADQC